LTKIGATSVLAAIKLEISPPLNATPTCGFLEVSVQLTPLCSPRFKVGKPSDECYALQQQVQRLLVEGHVIDLEQLCVEEGKAVWNLKLDVICLNHDGGCVDACVLAAMGALRDLKIPETVVREEEKNASSRGQGESRCRKVLWTVFILFLCGVLCWRGVCWSVVLSGERVGRKKKEKNARSLCCFFSSSFFFLFSSDE
jgi:exosome complex component RRP43